MSVWCVPYTFRHLKNDHRVCVYAGSLPAAMRTARVHLAYMACEE